MPSRISTGAVSGSQLASSGSSHGDRSNVSPSLTFTIAAERRATCWRASSSEWPTIQHVFLIALTSQRGSTSCLGIGSSRYTSIVSCPVWAVSPCRGSANRFRVHSPDRWRPFASLLNLAGLASPRRPLCYSNRSPQKRNWSLGPPLAKFRISKIRGAETLPGKIALWSETPDFSRQRPTCRPATLGNVAISLKAGRS
jgi:hypothetical protein